MKFDFLILVLKSEWLSAKATYLSGDRVSSTTECPYPTRLD